MTSPTFDGSLRAFATALLLASCSGGTAASRATPAPAQAPPQRQMPELQGLAGEPDLSVKTALPPLPRFQSVSAVANGDSVSITVEPIVGAKDYRVYPLPKDEDISTAASGEVMVKNAIYRCGGDRQSPAQVTDNKPGGQSDYMRAIVDGKEVEGFRRTLASATLGHVYVTPGPGRIPVYAVGDPAPNADNDCYHMRWGASRVKRYLTSEAERANLIRRRWRDDGIVFYVPAAKGAETRPVFRKDRLYFGEAAEKEARGGGEPVFDVLTQSRPGSVPLMRVYYLNFCGQSHDELVAGLPRFERARFQGDRTPMFDLRWTGLTGETTLVVEALDRGCPHQGQLAPIAKPAIEAEIDYEPWLTLDDMRAASPTREVYINGQHDPANRPRAIARSFVKVRPGPKPDMDWFAGFGPDQELPRFMSGRWDEPCGNPDGCWLQFRQKTNLADISFLFVEAERFAIGPILGALWVTYGDGGADIGGKFRMTANLKARMTAEQYLHVTMEVDSFTTGRRYPQILISDQDPPVQWNMVRGRTLIVQTFTDGGTGNWPHSYQIQLCDHRGWEVSDQCPAPDLYRRLAADGRGGVGSLSPNAEVAEHVGVDRATRFDAFLSTQRGYLFLDGQPYGCAKLPETRTPRGPVTVTFGDVLYHSGVDGVFRFHEKYQKIITRRHFDNLGFKSGVAAPAWDHDRLPCQNPPKPE
jgi:hypothetical protein